MVKNEKQQEVIKQINGIYVVDAGPGTGKTYSITKRFLEITKIQTKIDDILLLTFTNNAAEQMSEKVFGELIKTDPSFNFFDLNISTFHAFCKKILAKTNGDVTKYLDINEPLNPNFVLSQNEILEKLYFKDIYYDFKKNNPIYSIEYKIIGDRYIEILYTIRKLLSIGIFPKKDGWLFYQNSDLNCDKTKIKHILSEFNKAIELKNNKLKDSKLLKILKEKSKNKNYYDFFEIENNYQLKKDLIETAINQNKDNLINFIHGIYFNYIEQSIKDNKLTFDFLIMFAFIELYFNKQSRDSNSFEYVMIDEFQDTNEIQFMFSLLLMKKNNLCVVGDFKQGIYGFRNASIENIINFKENINKYKEKLNTDEIRINYDTTTLNKEFILNFRSSQKILNLSNHILYLKGSKKEEINTDLLDKNIVKLTANFDLDKNSEIKMYQLNSKENEIKFILKHIQDLINSDKKIIEYNIDNTYTSRKIKYSDIVILSRTKSFGLLIQKTAQEYNIPINYDGGIELFNTKESKILLSLLRIFTNKNDIKGWCSILDYLNYSILDKKEIIETKNYPKEIIELRNTLFKYQKNILTLISTIYRYFNIDNLYSNSIIKEIGSIFSTTNLSIQKLIIFIEENITNNETYELDLTTKENAVTIQTIHASKGLEYPIVIIGNCNQKQFPSINKETNIIQFSELIGLNCTKEYQTKNNYTAIYDNWKTDLLKSTDTSDYDEERRLFFTAITRAKQYVYITSHNPSTFFTELSCLENTKKLIKLEQINDDISLEIEKNKIISKNTEIKLEKYTKHQTILSPHDIMEYIQDKNGKGLDFGNKIHYMAQKIANGFNVKSNLKEIKTIKDFLKNTNPQKIKTEIECSVPINNTIFRGYIDLLLIYSDRIEIIDYKTDQSTLNHDNYIKQMSIYYYAVSQYYNKKTICKIFYVSLNKIIEIIPIEQNKLF
jgi:ATP-dependent helicase/nuclease subunit A